METQPTDGLVALSALAAAAPVLVYVLTIWWLDRYEREPLWLVGLVFLYGSIGGILIGVTISLVLVTAVGDAGSMMIQAGVIAPIAEEPAKGLIVMLLLLTRHFDNTTDGLVYGAASGLGFAMMENIFYFIEAHQTGGDEAWMTLVINRGLFTALMHTAASASFGAVIGYFRYRGKAMEWAVAPLLGLIPAVLIHGSFNSALVASSEAGDPTLGAAGLALVPVAVGVLLAVTFVSLSREHKMLHTELRAEAEAGLIPPEHAEILPFNRKRWRRGWLDPAIPRKRYVHLTTLLAFRRSQLRRKGAQGGPMEAEVAHLRQQISELLGRGAQV